MDTDDLTDDAYAIIIEARRVSGLLGAELAIAGKDARSEEEFLRNMLAALADANENIEDYLDDDDEEAVSERHLSRIIAHCENSARALLGRRSHS